MSKTVLIFVITAVIVSSFSFAAKAGVTTDLLYISVIALVIALVTLVMFVGISKVVPDKFWNTFVGYPLIIVGVACVYLIGSHMYAAYGLRDLKETFEAVALEEYEYSRGEYARLEDRDEKRLLAVAAERDKWLREHEYLTNVGWVHVGHGEVEFRGVYLFWPFDQE